MNVNTDSKRCTKCGRWLSLAAFSKKRSTFDGLQKHCKECCIAYLAGYRALHRESIRAQKRQHRSETLEASRARDRESYIKHGPKRRAYQRTYRQIHSDKVRSRKRLYREQNKEKIRAHFQEYYRANAAKLRRATREWQRRNPDKVAAIARRRREREAAATGYLSAEEWVVVCERYNNRCLVCGAKGALTVDHIVPIAKGGTKDVSNVQPLCQSCNSSKGDQTIDYRPDRKGLTGL